MMTREVAGSRERRMDGRRGRSERARVASRASRARKRYAGRVVERGARCGGERDVDPRDRARSPARAIVAGP